MRKLLLFLALLGLGPALLAASPLPERLAPLVKSGAILLVDEQGNPLLAHNASQPLIPASIVKILTAQIAIEKLGPDFRFPTRFYLDSQQNLYVQGLGDPFLISDEIRLMATELKAQGLTKINRLYLDASAFAVTGEIPGSSGSQNPYDALNGALVVNFNSLLVGRDKAGQVYSGEKETPLTPLAREKARALKPGFSDRLNLTTDPKESLRYVGELFSAIFEEQGLVIQQGFAPQATPVGLELYWEHRSTKSLDLVLEGLLRFSNNFIANQIYLYLGMQEHGLPAELDKGRWVFEEFLAQHYGQYQIHLIEASGLSKENRLSAEAMIQILEDFKPHAALLTEKGGVPLKSGTLTGVYNYAGYLPGKRGHYSFVIMLNQSANQRDAVLKELKLWALEH